MLKEQVREDGTMWPYNYLMHIFFLKKKTLSLFLVSNYTVWAEVMLLAYS